MAEHYGVQTASGHLRVAPESKEPYAADVLTQLNQDAAAVIARYPEKRSALLPLLHLVQSVDGYVTGRGIDFCAEVLELETAEVSGVATFYTQYKRHPNGEYTVGVCINTLCAVMGGDRIWDDVSDYLGVGHDETTADGKVTLERIECNAACDYAPVVMTNWEFFDNQTPESTRQLVDDLRAGKPVAPTRGADTVCTFKQMSRVLAGFLDGRADEGVGAGPASLLGLEIARKQGWSPSDGVPTGRSTEQEASGTPEPDADASVPHDVDAAAPTDDAPPQSPHEVADADKPVEATEQPEATADADDHPEGEPVPVQGMPAIVAEADTGTVDQPAAAVAGTTGAAVPAAVAAEAADAEAPTTPLDVVAAQTVSPDPLPADTAEEADDAAGMTVPRMAPNISAPEEQQPFISSVPFSTGDDAEARSAEGSAVPAYEDPDATVSRASLASTTMATDDPNAGDPERIGSDIQDALDRGDFEDGGYGEGSAAPAADGSGPTGWQVKGNENSMLFHTMQSPWYERTKAEVWFKDTANAERAGFTDALHATAEKADEEDES